MNNCQTSEQSIIIVDEFGPSLAKILQTINAKNYLLVCGKSFYRLGRNAMLAEIPVPYTSFMEFSSNPTYEEVQDGVELLLKGGFDAIVACGGGSAIDVAKCIKGFSGLDSNKNYLEQGVRPNNLPLIAIPTTAGTGSESTSFAVIYYEGEKQSVDHSSLLPGHAILAANLLASLPTYQKVCTMFDALCQAIESWWSVHSSEESISYSREAIERIVAFHEIYLTSLNPDAASQIMLASNYAGRAINLTKTTAPHAMSYKLTSLYGMPHGHAVALCLPEVWEYMLRNMRSCIDVRGQEYLNQVFFNIATALKASTPENAIQQLRKMISYYNLEKPRIRSIVELESLVDSVNTSRLINNPISIDSVGLKAIYKNVVLDGGISAHEG